MTHTPAVWLAGALSWVRGQGKPLRAVRKQLQSADWGYALTPALADAVMAELERVLAADRAAAGPVVSRTDAEIAENMRLSAELSHDWNGHGDSHGGHFED